MPVNSQNILKELEVSKLPTLPSILADVLDSCQNHDSSFQSLAEIIARDASISARVVAMANSTLYNRGTPIRSLDRALLVLGIDTIRTIVITASIHQFFSGLSHGNHEFLKEFWRRSLSCALLAKSLAILTSYPKPEEAYLTGLLHNIGELVLSRNFNKEYLTLREEQPDEDKRLKHELGTFGIDHAELGAQLANEWGLSPYAIDAIRYHHANTVDILGAQHLVKILYTASALSNDAQQSMQQSVETTNSLFELNPSLISEICRKIDEEVIQVAESMGVQLDKQDDQEAHISLARAIRDQNLQNISRDLVSKAKTKIELATQIQHSLSLLLGTRQTALFWNEDNELVLIEDSYEAPLCFPLNEGSSLAAKSALRNEVLSSIDDDSAFVADQQILRLLDAQHMLCLPLLDGERIIAVIATTLHSNKERLHPNFLSILISQFKRQCIDIEQAHCAENTDSEINSLNAKVREIAHEANNPLSIINNYLSSLSLKLSEEDEVQEELQVLKEELERASQIIFRLRDLQQDITHDEGDADINLEIKNLLTLYKSSLFLAKSIDSEYLPDSSLRPVDISPGSLRQILTNLMKNAVEAMPEGGKISVATKSSINVNGHSFCEIKITDNGPGIPEEIQKNLFTPVSTTKGAGHSGLGLSITKNLVTEARGTITCRSDGKGTQFQILLPEQ
ncbi:hypothetical protein A3715_02350 [Oleiphilus sp. HI0009]|nr:hypothetical protein A3715_02350 [Oleiphilus sp. HI0009]